MRVKGIREEIKYNFQIDGQIIQDSRARYLCNVPDFGGVIPERFAAAGKPTIMSGKKIREPVLLSETILYKLQVRSFTMHKSSGVRKKGTFQGLEQKIPYLQDLGVTAVLLMPAYEYREWERIKRRNHLYGYIEENTKTKKSPGSTAGAIQEMLATMRRKLHSALRNTRCRNLNIWWMLFIREVWNVLWSSILTEILPPQKCWIL